MKLFSIDSHPSNGLDPKTIKKHHVKLKTIIDTIREAQHHGYDTPYASINLCNDQTLRQHITTLANKYTQPTPSALAIIGIGGSNLGTRALHKALNIHTPNTLFFDTLDSDTTYAQLQQLRHHLEHKQHVIINVISKSGTTTETIAHLAVVMEHARIVDPDSLYHKVVVTTDRDSKLWHFATERGLDHLEIPHHVGGRYSVFSAVGLFPLALLGIDISQLHNGGCAALEICTQLDTLNNPAALRALMLFEHYQHKRTIHDMFVFSPLLQEIGNWYRQLIGESIGKAQDVNGRPLHVGITPTVSIGSTDLHSVGQLYLSGPDQRFTTFVSIEHTTQTITIPPSPSIDSLVSNISGTTYQSVMNSIMTGTQQAYEGQGRPFTTITLPKLNEYNLGALLQMHMLEIIYLAHLFDINPFDQPQVELYKQETRKILAHE